MLLADSSAVVLKPVAPFFIDTMSRGTPPEIMAMRGGCGPNRKLGCDLLWNFLFLRGAGPGDSRVLEYIHGAISKGEPVSRRRPPALLLRPSLRRQSPQG